MLARQSVEKALNRLERLFFGMPPRVPGEVAVAAPLAGVFNPAFIPAAFAPGVDLAFIARETYYELDARSYMIGEADPARARNILVGLKRAGAGYEEIFRRPVPALDRVEDTRFYQFGGQTFLTGLQLSAEAGGRHAPVLGTLTRAGDTLEAKLVTPTEQVARVEKNWAYFERDGGLWIEKWPGGAETYKVDPQTLALRYQRTGEPDRGWSGTKGVSFDGGMLFLDHRRIYLFEGGRLPIRFIFRFRFEAAGRPAVISRAFSLDRHDALVYVSDIVIDGARALIGYGVNDAQSAIHAIDIAALRQFLGLA